MAQLLCVDTPCRRGGGVWAGSSPQGWVRGRVPFPSQVLSPGMGSSFTTRGRVGGSACETWGDGGVSVPQVLTCEQRIRLASPRARLFRLLHPTLVAAVSSVMVPLSYSLHSSGRQSALPASSSSSPSSPWLPSSPSRPCLHLAQRPTRSVVLVIIAVSLSSL